MKNTNGALSFDAYIGDTDFNRTADAMTRRIVGIGNATVSETKRMEDSFTNLGRIAAGAFAGMQLAQLPAEIVKVRGEFQQLEIALNTMLGSKAKADKLMGEIVQTAASTPFGLKDLAAGTKQLLAYGSASNQIIGEIRTLGDVASGVSVPINELIYLYGTLRSQGRAYAVDIRQFAGRGIPIYAELAKVLKVQVSEVNALVEAGKVGFPQVEQAFKNMTSAGGMFNNLMDAQSKSIPGLIERLRDGIDVAFNDIGKSNEGLITDVVKGVTVAVENYERIVDALTVIVATYGSYRAAILLVNTLKASEATSYAAVTAGINAQSGAIARGIALETKRAQATAARKAALAQEAFALSLNAAAQVQSLRAEVSVAAAKKASTVATARAATIEIASSQARLLAAQTNSAAISANATAELKNKVAKELQVAQNAMLVASERGVTASRAASAASSDFSAKKTALETATKTANSLVTNTNTTAQAASVAAKSASAIADTKMTFSKSLYSAVTSKATAIQAAFNATLLSNPIVAATVAIVALAGAVWYLSDSTTAAEVAQKSLNKILEDQKKAKEDLIGKTSELTAVISSDTSTAFAQIQAYTALQKLYPALLGNLDLHAFKALGAAEAQRKLNEAMDQIGIASTSSELDKANKKIDDLTKKLDTLKQQQAKSGAGSGAFLLPIGDTEKAIEAARIEAKKLGDQEKQNTADAWEANALASEKLEHYKKLQTSLLDQRKGIEDNVTGLRKAGVAANDLQIFFANMSLAGVNQQLDQVGGKILAMQGKSTVLFGGNKAHWEKIKADANSDRDALGVSQAGSAEWKRLTKEIDEADKKLQAYSATKKAAKVAEKDKPQPFGSLAYYEQIARKADEIIAKTPGDNTSELNRQNQIKIEAEKKADEIRKVFAVKTYEEELEEKKKAYELYQKWIDNYGKESADKQFSELISSNQSYVAFLDQEIKKLESLQNFTTLNDKDTGTLLNLRSERTEAVGGPSKIDQFTKSLEKAKEETGSLTEYIALLKKAQDSLNASAPTSDVKEQKKIAAEFKLDAEKQRRDLLTQFLLSTEQSEERRIEIESHYADLRKELEEKTQGEKTQAYFKTLDLINKAESEEFEARKIKIREASEEYKALVKAVEDAANSNGLFDQIKKQKDLVASLLASEGYSETSMQEQRKLASMQRAMYSQIAGAVGELGDALRNVGGITGEIGQALSGIASQANSLITVFDKNATAAEKWGAAIQSVSNLINIVASSAKQRKQAESEYYASVINQQSQYNILMNEAIGMQSQLNESVFVTDYEGKIVSGIKMMADAQSGYEKSLEALEDGRAKIGQRNKVDWGAVGSGAASGVVLGAAIGSAIPVIGNIVGGVIGGVVGGIAGIFGGKKKGDEFGGLLDVFPELIDQAGEFNTKLAETLIANNLVDDATKALLQDTIAWSEQLEKAKEQIKSVIVDLSGGLGDGIRDALVGAFKDGTSAAEAFGGAVSKILGDMISQIVFSKMFAKDFKKLESDMEASYGLDGDQNFVDDIIRFYETAGDKAQSYLDALAAAQSEGEKYGLDLFDKTSQSSKKTDPLSGAIQGMSQETASVLAGQFNALRISGADSASSLRQILLFQANISRNSDFQKHLVRLEGIETVLREIKGGQSLRGSGL